MTSALTLAQAVWLFPVWTAVHFLEEAPGFANWARRYISPRYSDAHWRKIHAAGIVFATASAAVVSLWPHPVAVFLFCALSLTPMLFNLLFHLAASVFSRSYSPGVVSALLLFPVLSWYLVSLFSDAGLLHTKAGMLAAVIGAATHAMDLALTTFFMGTRSTRGGTPIAEAMSPEQPCL